jgi:hypothetical protein
VRSAVCFPERGQLQQLRLLECRLEDSMYTLAREATAAKAERDAARAEMEALKDAHQRQNAAMELLGEREERIAELEADMMVRVALFCQLLSRTHLREIISLLHEYCCIP